MFSLFSSSKEKRVTIDPRKSVAEAPKSARPWPFLASSPPVQRAPPRRSLSLPQHVAIFSDTQYVPRASLTNSSGVSSYVSSSAESSPVATTPTRMDSIPREARAHGKFDFSGISAGGESQGMGAGLGSTAEELRQDKRQLRTSLVPDLF